MIKNKKGSMVPKTISNKAKASNRVHKPTVPKLTISVEKAAELFINLIQGLDYRILDEMHRHWAWVREGEFSLDEAFACGVAFVNSTKFGNVHETDETDDIPFDVPFDIPDQVTAGNSVRIKRRPRPAKSKRGASSKGENK